MKAAVGRGRALAETPTAVGLRERFDRQLRFLLRRIEPSARFGFFFTAGLAPALASATLLVPVVEGAAEGDEVARVDSYVLDFFAERRSDALDSAMRAVAAAGAVEGSAALLVVVVAVAVVVPRGWD